MFGCGVGGGVGGHGCRTSIGVGSKKERNVCFTNDERVVLGHPNMFFCGRGSKN